MSGYLSVIKVSDSVLEELRRRGEVHVPETELFKSFSGEVSSSFFEIVLGWMHKQGTISRTQAFGQWSATLTVKGVKRIVENKPGYSVLAFLLEKP